MDKGFGELSPATQIATFRNRFAEMKTSTLGNVLQSELSGHAHHATSPYGVFKSAMGNLSSDKKVPVNAAFHSNDKTDACISSGMGGISTMNSYGTNRVSNVDVSSDSHGKSDKIDEGNVNVLGDMPPPPGGFESAKAGTDEIKNKSSEQPSTVKSTNTSDHGDMSKFKSGILKSSNVSDVESDKTIKKVSFEEGVDKNRESPTAHENNEDPGKKPSVSFADALNKNAAEAKKSVNFSKVDVVADVDGAAEVMIPLSSVQEVSNRLRNSVYGYFIGKRVAYPVVEAYTWAKFGLQKVMMNSRGFFFFKFTSEKGVQDVLSGGPWMIRNTPIILNKWSPTTNVTKNDHSVVPVWVKLHDVSLPAFTEDGLSAISSRIGNPKMLDVYTSAMCTESWGRSSFARAMIEISADSELKEEVIVGVPNIDGKGHVCEKIRVEYEWKPPQCLECKLFGHGVNDCPQRVVPKVANMEAGHNADGFQVGKGRNKGRNPTFGQKKKFEYRPRQTDGAKKQSNNAVKTSNSFASLASSDTNKGASTSSKQSTESGREQGKNPSLYQKWQGTDGDSEDDVEDDDYDPLDYDAQSFLESLDRSRRKKK